jgi:hypothetical protein
MRKILPFLLGLIGLGVGVGAGMTLRPTMKSAGAAAEVAAETGVGAGEHGATEPEAAPDTQGAHDEGADADLPEYVKLSNQFIVPIVEDGRVSAMVIMSLSLEVAAGSTDAVFAREPKLRDSFLQILFDHANAGGFNGSFTDGANLIVLRRSLLEASQEVLGDAVHDVLIGDLARQDS